MMKKNEKKKISIRNNECYQLVISVWTLDSCSDQLFTKSICLRFFASLIFPNVNTEKYAVLFVFPHTMKDDLVIYYRIDEEHR